MLGLQGNSSPSRVYRCVACSATFTGLASLLVHQATHANTASKLPDLPPNEPSTTPHQTMLSPPTPLAESSAPSFYICDCGEEFLDFNLMLEHKRSHVPNPHLLQSLIGNTVHSSGAAGYRPVYPTQQEAFKPPVTQTVLALVNQPVSAPGNQPVSALGNQPVSAPGNQPVSALGNQPVLTLGYPSTSVSHEVHPPTDHKVDVSLKEGVTRASTPQDQCKSPQDRCEEAPEKLEEVPENLSTPQEPGPIQDMPPQDKTNSSLSSNKNNTLMKMLATAYMKRFPPPQTESTRTVIPKTEVIPVEVTPAIKTEPSSPEADPSLGQLRRLLKKSSTKTKAPTVGRILDSSKKSIVSLTKTFSPVVLLETRQKLIDPNSNGEHGIYQCCRCRKVYQDVDKLTEHHLLHRKERIKCCRHCKQLIIGKLPFPDNHICPQLGGKAAQQSCSLKSKLPFVKKIQPFHSVNHAKRVFFCPLCKHSYARRYNLKMHKCQGPGASPSQHATPSSQKTQVLRSNNEASTDAEISKSVAVGPEGTAHIKVEVTSENSEQSAYSELAWSGSAKSFLPFYAKASMLEQGMDDSLQQGEDSSWDTGAAGHEENDEGQWTMPLDDEMEVLSSAEDADNGAELKKPPTALPSLPFFISNGVKRYPCNRCQKTYSRQATLRRHLRLCGFRPHGFGAAPQRGGAGAIPLNANKTRPMFDCPVCGRLFNRKDNMLTHHKKCQLKQPIANMDRALQQSFSSSAPERQNKQDDDANWGIMSLPSVLPRRVTCECGVGFTSPRLLLEHLQKHAQESYTCPTCGETVNSWADYELHLQIHMHPRNQLFKGLQPQRSQPLLLRFQQQPPQQQPSQSGHRPPQSGHRSHPSGQRPQMKQPIAAQLPDSNKKQRIACIRCTTTFSNRHSLRRHISLNRCKGSGRVTNPPKTHHCSRCNAGFPTTISLMFHQKSGICKPAIKPVRCPVCVRWFSTMDGLQKHMLTHNQSASYRCDVCQGMYSNLKSLKNHRRRIHRIMVGGTMPKTK